MQVDIHFAPGAVGDHRGELVVQYDSGEEVGVGLYGGAVDSNVRLDRGSVKMDSTYISMSSQRWVGLGRGRVGTTVVHVHTRDTSATHMLCKCRFPWKTVGAYLPCCPPSPSCCVVSGPW